MDPLTRALWLMLSIFPLTQGQPITILAGSATDRNYLGVPCTGAPAWTCPYSDAMLPAAYPTLRYGLSVHYSIPVPAGVYVGWITFVEPNKTAAGQRLMTVSIQGQTSAPLDAFALAGGDDKPYKFPFLAIVSTNVLDIVVAGTLGNAVISAIDVAGQKIDASQGPGRFYLGSGPAPTSTTDPATGIVFAAVIYVDLDRKTKILSANGTIVVLTP